MNMTFGKRLEERMISSGYNKNSLAREAKMHPTTLKNWIEDITKPDDLKLDTIAKILTTTKEYLYTGVLSVEKKLEKKIDIDFYSLSIEEKLKMIFDQNNRIIEELAQHRMDNKDHKNIIIDYIDLSLQPVMEFVGANKKQKENK
ncbi:MAG: hypothetical protein K0R36_595 [Chryseobacterium sp.]|jgi:transcriptional regulator with XRE-family HTH domain|nr:hypothetical protein [Chryseobacterium sp.]